MHAINSGSGNLRLKALLFVSGISALIFQTVWIKQLSLVVGVEVYAVSIGVSGFFAGLAAGAAAFGAIADRSTRPLRLYAFIEFGIAIIAVLSSVALTHAPALFVELQDAIGWLAFALPFGLVALPAFLMGGTLPALLAVTAPRDGTVGRDAGGLYAANTAGAIAGVVLTIFVALPMLGIFRSAMLAASFNALLAVAALMMSAHRQVPGSTGVQREALPAMRLALALYAVAGGIALGYEVVWTQVIVQFLSTRAVAFGVVLATYLTGLVIGSWLFARVADQVGRPWFSFGVLIGGAGVASLASLALLGPWLPALQDSLGTLVLDATGSRMIEMCCRFAVAAATLILPATILLGAAFPAAARLIVDSRHAGRDIGYALALNTAFGILGSLVTGFILIPVLGLVAAMGCLATCAVLVGAVAIIREVDLRPQANRLALAMLGITLVGAVALPRDKLARLLAQERGGQVVYYDEGPAGTVAVIEQDTPRGQFRRLYIQGVSNSGDVMPSKRYMRLQGLLPLLVHPQEARSAMVIAFGTGITAGSLLAYPTLERRVVVELLQPVVDAAPYFEGNLGAGNDPRLEVTVADGRHELMRRDERFDFITLEPPPPAASGVVNLYSREFYQLARERLEPGGLLAQWLPIATQNDEDTQSLVRSMLDVFPHVSLWTTEVHEMMLVGSEEPLALDFKTVRDRMQAPTVQTALAEVGINSAADLLATYITDRSGLEAYAGQAPAVTDDRPRIEFAPWVRSREILRVLPKLLGLSSPVPMTASPAEAAAVEESFAELLNFYEAAYRSYSDDARTWEERRLDLGSAARDNAYFAWFFTGVGDSAETLD